ncbi:hypothetical protein OIU84_018221 [Salix udensis]|uniref:Uncharacterized protein n=1 Tax=Salix udensis TaxID=889485 RepID=A0AAD6PMN6_9ROSI|nr:hypothetical protein OIU84_018221 [Salix udensis]
MGDCLQVFGGGRKASQREEQLIKPRNDRTYGPYEQPARRLPPTLKHASINSIVCDSDSRSNHRTDDHSRTEVSCKRLGFVWVLLIELVGTKCRSIEVRNLHHCPLLAN